MCGASASVQGPSAAVLVVSASRGCADGERVLRVAVVPENRYGWKGQSEDDDEGRMLRAGMILILKILLRGDMKMEKRKNEIEMMK